MKALSAWFLPLLIAVASCTAVVAASPAADRPDAVARWEYRVLTRQQILDLGKQDLGAGLNKLGDEGWDLVAAQPDYIFKRPKDQLRRQAAAVRRRIALIEADVEQLKERAAWAERMVKKGYLSGQQVEEEKRRLKAAETALDEARDELKALPPEPDGAVEKESKPEK